jgi:hypothetical protein
MEISDIAKWIQLTLRSNITLKLKRTMIDRMLRSIPSPRPLLVSEKAQDVGTAMGLGDLRQYRWKDQRKKMKDSKRSIFHYEHKTPLNQIITEMVEDDSVRNIVSAIHKIQIVKYNHFFLTMQIFV